MTTLANYLDQMTNVGELVETQPDGALRCVACGHRCLIREGKRGICQVRYNQGGQLRIPWGYVAALNADPVEKKPFYHLQPGSVALTFGMLGCDFHCGYCFTGDTITITNQGPISLEEIFGAARADREHPEIAYPPNLQAITGSGNLRNVRAVFRHPYRGTLTVLKPYYLPMLKCTPDHKIYATDNPLEAPRKIKANQLTSNFYLAVPRNYSFQNCQLIEADRELADHRVTYDIPWKLTPEQRALIQQETVSGKSSREIGLMLDMNPSYVRHIRSKEARGRIRTENTTGYIIENERIRFPKEHRPGIPNRILLNEELAYLFGFYCAEGSIVADKTRPNSYKLNFSLSLSEENHAEKLKAAIANIFCQPVTVSRHHTSLVVTSGKSSLALLFMSMMNKGARNKQVPECILDAPRNVMKVFLDACVDGDGHHYENGKISLTTVSPKFAYGVAWLALRLGYLPSLYKTNIPLEGVIQGRQVKRSPNQYTVVWYEEAAIPRKIITTKKYYLVPLKEISSEEFDGYVFNMEVEEEHNYLAGFFLVSNCQNWLTSQALRDPAADESGYYVKRISPEQIVEVARRSGAEVVASSYNEPLITSEWAVAVFRQAKQAGMKCVYVSNGNATPEVLEYLRPYLNGMKIDLKSMQEKNYRQLGGVLKNVLDTIRRVKEMGLWLEVVTLVVPGFNDSNDELWEAARYLASISADIPWHVTAFHSDYKMSDTDNTPASTLMRAAEIGREAGLRYVYAGNLPGRVGEYEDTCCPKCNTPLVRRSGFFVRENRLTAQGTCPKCGEKVAGVWM